MVFATVLYSIKGGHWHSQFEIQYTVRRIKKPGGEIGAPQILVRGKGYANKTAKKPSGVILPQ